MSTPQTKAQTAAPTGTLPTAIAATAVRSSTSEVASLRRLSPSSIVKKLGISPRVVTMLEGESLLNDATALVLLRTAIAAIAVGSVPRRRARSGRSAGACSSPSSIGALVGLLALRVRGVGGATRRPTRR